MGIALALCAALLVAVQQVRAQTASAVIVSQLDRGDSGTEVTNLQTLLSTDVSIYPERLVTGYFGPLTESAVQRFQCREGIVCSGTPVSTGYGRVGPSTLARLNIYVAAGGTIGGTVGGGQAPLFSNVVVTRGAGTATITWNTNEAARGKVYYQTSFPTMIEGSATSQVSISGTPIEEAALSTSHTIAITGLQPGQTYYYVLQSTDANGNVSVLWPNTFMAQ